MDLKISCPIGAVTAASILATLTPHPEDFNILIFKITGYEAQLSGFTIDNGCYTLNFIIRSGETPVAGAVDVVRIVAGQITQGVYFFSNLNTPSGAQFPDDRNFYRNYGSVNHGRRLIHSKTRIDLRARVQNIFRFYSLFYQLKPIGLRSL